MKLVPVLNNQSIWDLAIQEYGHSDGVLQLMIDNPGVINFNTAPVAGTKIIIDETKIINKATVDYYDSQGIKPATAAV